MASHNEIHAQAMQIVTARAQEAKLSVRRREEEIAGKLPQIAALRRELAGTSIQLTKIILSGQGNVKQQLEELKQRNLYVQSRIEELLRENGYPADYLGLHPVCPLCKDTGFVGNEKCTCLKSLMKELSIQKLNECSPLKLSSFETFDLRYYPAQGEGGASPREIMGKIFDYCVDYAERFSHHSPSLMLMGNTGLGKTHLSLAIARRVIDKGFTVLYGSTQDFLRAVESEHFGRAQEENDTLSMLLQADLLILDDLGVEFNSDFYVSSVYNVINTRLNTEKPTIINSNLTVQEMEKKYSQRIVSRLFSSYNCLRFAGKDIRLLKKREAAAGSR